MAGTSGVSSHEGLSYVLVKIYNGTEPSMFSGF